MYTKRARFARFDLNISDELFVLPDFPIEENTLMEDTIKTTQLHSADYFYKKILHGTDENRTKESFYRFTNMLVQKEKEKLPHILEYMKEARVCISLAENQNNANTCTDDLSEVIKTTTQSADLSIGIWSKERKEKILDYLEENILKLQSYMPCIKRVQNIDNLAMCMDK